MVSARFNSETTVVLLLSLVDCFQLENSKACKKRFKKHQSLLLRGCPDFNEMYNMYKFSLTLHPKWESDKILILDLLFLYKRSAFFYVLYMSIEFHSSSDNYIHKIQIDLIQKENSSLRALVELYIVCIWMCLIYRWGLCLFPGWLILHNLSF